MGRLLTKNVHMFCRTNVRRTFKKKIRHVLFIVKFPLKQTQYITRILQFFFKKIKNRLDLKLLDVLEEEVK